MPNFKTIMFSQNKISFSKIFFSLFFFGLLFSVLPSVVKADSVAVTGYAWSSNIGWIKFDTGKTNPVMYDTVSGQLSGYAWSSNIGWIKFDGLSSSSGGIGGSGAVASPKTGTGYFSGWARACAGTADGECKNMNSRNDGWDGWIKFDTGKSNPVSIDFATGDFHGYAWGSEVVGWISFNCAEGGSTLNSICGTSDYKVSITPEESEEKQTLTVNIYGEKWTNGTIAGGTVTGDNGFSCVGNKTTDSSVAVGADKPLVTCTKNYAKYKNVNLFASPAIGCSAGGCVLKKWDGACSGGNCSLTMDKDKTVDAYFKVSTGIPKGGGSSSSSSVGGSSSSSDGSSSSSSSGGGGSSSSSGGGGGGGNLLTVIANGKGAVDVENGGVISFTCYKSTCSQSYSSGTKLKLTATPDSGATFTGWSIDCTNSGECSLTMDGARTVQADFFPDDDTVSSSSSSVAPPIDGACGDAHKNNTKKAPQAELCREGNASAVTENETLDRWEWTCSGLNGGDDANCYAGKLEVIIQEI